MVAAQRWRVVGGADKGGILARAGCETTSEQLPGRLATDAVVEEVGLSGERLHFRRVEGGGPDCGWVSVSLKGKPLLVHHIAEDPPAQAVDEPFKEAEVAEEAKAAEEGKSEPELRTGDYYVTLGVLFKKPGEDPEGKKVISLSRKVGHVVHTVGDAWRGPSGGYWAKLDVSRGDSGAGEKPGYVMIDAAGFGTPGPCLQLASAAEGAPVILRATAPQGATPWDGKEPRTRSFVATRATTVGDVARVLTMLFALKGDVRVDGAGASDTVGALGWNTGDEVQFVASTPGLVTLVVMNPLQAGAKLLDVPTSMEATIAQVRTQIAKLAGLKEGSMIMVQGKMGQRVKEDANLDIKSTVSASGYGDGDEIGFIYTGDLETDLAGFLSAR